VFFDIVHAPSGRTHSHLLGMLRVLGLAVVLHGARLLLDDEEEKNRPVARVIKLLKDMQKQLAKEAKEDQEVYDKVSCWCETNGKEKSRAVEIAEQRIAQLNANIEEFSARSAELKTDIEKVEEDVATNQQTLNKAAAMREKENAAFSAEEKDMIQSIVALKSAIEVLKKHQSLSQESLLDVRATIDRIRTKHQDLLAGIIAPSDKEALTGFLQQPSGYQAYSNQSGEIFGILQQMLETFQANLTQGQADELAAQESFKMLRSAKEAEIAAGKDQLDNKRTELAETDESLAQAKQDREDTENALTDDQKFLLDLRKRCKVNDKEYEERTKARQEEIKGISEALAILTHDDAFDTFGRTFSFVQVSRGTSVSERARAAKVLRAAAGRTKDAALLEVAAEAQLADFTRVKKAIDDMIVALQAEKADEIKHKDWCNEEFNGNEKQTAQSNRQKEDFENQIADLEQSITTLKTDVATLREEVKEMQVQTQRASENRARENKEFQSTVSDQRATQQILERVLARLRKVYAKDSSASLAQASQEPGAKAPPAPEGFKDYKQNAGATGVVSLLTQIIGDTKRMENDAVKAEQDAQQAYEEFVKDSNEGIAQRQRDITHKTEAKAAAQVEKSVAEGGLTGTVRELEKLDSYKGGLHKSCDYVLKNFDIRQTARDEEVEALRQAKAILSGADFQ